MNIRAVPSKYVALHKSGIPSSKTGLPKFSYTDKIYSKIKIKGVDAIPGLIKFLGDTTETNIKDNCGTGNFTIGQLSFFLINDIETIPLAYVTNMQFDVIHQCGCLADGVLLYLKQRGNKFKDQYRRYYYSDGRQKIIHLRNEP